MFLKKVTGYEEPQMKRLIKRWKKAGYGMQKENQLVLRCVSTSLRTLICSLRQIFYTGHPMDFLQKAFLMRGVDHLWKLCV